MLSQLSIVRAERTTHGRTHFFFICIRLSEFWLVSNYNREKKKGTRFDGTQKLKKV